MEGARGLSGASCIRHLSHSQRKRAVSSLSTNSRVASVIIHANVTQPHRRHKRGAEKAESEGLGQLENGARHLSHPLSMASILPRSDQTGDQLPCDDSLMHLWKPAASGPFLGDICQDLESLRLSSLTLRSSG